jgi:hypothetical protein
MSSWMQRGWQEGMLGVSGEGEIFRLCPFSYEHGLEFHEVSAWSQLFPTKIIELAHTYVSKKSTKKEISEASQSGFLFWRFPSNKQNTIETSRKKVHIYHMEPK